MARKDTYKTIQIPQDLHARLTELADTTDLSATKWLELILRKGLNDIEDNSWQLAMKKDASGKSTLELL